MIELYENATHLVLKGPEDLLATVDEDFAYRPNGFQHAISYERWRLTRGKEGWDGYLHPLRLDTPSRGQMLRGYKQELEHCCQMHRLPFKWVRPLPQAFSLTLDDIPPNLLPGAGFQLDDRQREGIALWLTEAIGVCKVTVSGGKTAMFAGAAAFIRRRFPTAKFLYVTQAERLVKQVTGEFRKFFPAWDVGQFGGGHDDYDAKDVVVCTVAMLNRHYAMLLQGGWFKTFTGLLYDEVHHCGAKSSERIILSVPAYFRLGASDSIKESDPRRNNSIRGLFGSVLLEVAAGVLMQEGRVAKPTIYMLESGLWKNRFQQVGYAPALGSPGFVLCEREWIKAIYRGPVFALDEEGKVKTEMRPTAEKDEETGEWKKIETPVTVDGLHLMEINGELMEIESRWCLLHRAYDRAIIGFKERNDLIVKWAQYFSGRGWPTVLVCTRTLHCYILEGLLKKVLDPELVDVLVGEATPKQRNACFDWFKRTPGAVLITPLVKEGVSINEIKAGVVCDYVADFEVANQIIGRFIRQKDVDNTAEIVWFNDTQHPIFRSGCRALFHTLQRTYTKQGYRFLAAPVVDVLLAESKSVTRQTLK